MANILSDNTVIPSYLGTRDRGQGNSTAILNDFTLHIGEVKKLVYPTDTNSYSKKNLEYEVEVQFRDGNGVYVTSLYRGVTASNVFGGVADRFHSTFRADSRRQGQENEDVGVGSKVLLLCLSGDQQKAIILGGLNDPRDTNPKPVADDGHNLFFEFNGVQFQINKDGEAKLVFGGATQASGDLVDDADADASGSYVEINRDGNVTISTPDKNQFLLLNHKDKKLEVQVDQEWNTKVNGDIVCRADKTITVGSGQNLNLNSDANVNIKSTGVMVGDATDSWPLFSTYRQQQQVLHNMMISAMAQLLTAATALVSSGGTPPGAVAFGTAVAAVATQMTSAISSFEGAGITYISKKNRND